MWPMPARGRFRGYIVPGPGPSGPRLKGPGRVQLPTLSFGIAPWGVFRGGRWAMANNFLLFSIIWAKIRTKFEWRTFLFCSSPNFGQKIGQYFSKDLVFLLFTYFWAKNFAQVWCPKRFGGPVSTFVPPGKISLWSPGCDYDKRTSIQQFV